MMIVHITHHIIMSFFESSLELSPNSFKQDDITFLKEGMCCVVLYYVPWCPYCKKIEGLWKELSTKTTFFCVKALNCEKYKEFATMMREELEGFRGYPTIVFYKQGKPVEIYKNERNLESLLAACYRVCSGVSV